MRALLLIIAVYAVLIARHEYQERLDAESRVADKHRQLDSWVKKYWRLHRQAELMEDQIARLEN